MDLFEKIVNKEEKISLVGLGYVGMPIAVAFASKGVNVVGFDLKKKKLNYIKRALIQQTKSEMMLLKIQR